MNEKDESVFYSLLGDGLLTMGQLNDIAGKVCGRLEQRGWRWQQGWITPPPVPPTPHWRDLPAGPELDAYVQTTLYPDEFGAVPRRSTDDALVVGVMRRIIELKLSPDLVHRGRGEWACVVDRFSTIDVDRWPLREIASTPAMAVCRAALAAHEAGR